MRFVNYYCCQNIRKYPPNDTLKALLPCSPAGYFSSVLHTGCTGSRPVLAWTLPYFPLYRKCTLKTPFYTITVCRLQQPCYRNINSFLWYLLPYPSVLPHFVLLRLAVDSVYYNSDLFSSHNQYCNLLLYTIIMIYFFISFTSLVYHNTDIHYSIPCIYCILLLWYTDFPT